MSPRPEHAPAALPVWWTLKSKEPGDSADYHVLRSGPGAVDPVEPFLRTVLPGTPTTQRGRPGSLPWFTVGAHVDGHGERCLTLARMDWNGEYDYARREIAATLAVLLRADDLRHRQLGYATLCAALAAVPAPSAGASLDLFVTPGRPPAPAPATARWAAGVAALLLEGRVVVTGTSGLDTAARVDLVDAVTGLLPWTFRSELSFSTWVSAPGQRPHRLCFADHGDEALVGVRHGETPPSPTTAVATTYLARLLDCIERERTDDLLAHFAAVVTPPVSFDTDTDTELALDVLGDFELGRTVSAALRAGTARAREVLMTISRHGPDGFEDDVRRLGCTLALEWAREDHVDRIGAWWSPALLDAVGDLACRAGSGTEATQRAMVVRRLARHPAVLGDGDRLCAAALGPVPPGPRRRRVPHPVLAAVRDVLIENGPPPWEALRRRLRDDVELAVRLAVEGTDPRHVAPLLGWLGADPVDPATAEWTGLLRFVAGDPAAPEPADGTADRVRDRHVALLLGALEIGARCGTTAHVPHGYWADALVVAAADRRDHALTDVLADTVPRPQDPGIVAAYLDVLCVVVRGQFPLRDEAPHDPTGYVDALAAIQEAQPGRALVADLLCHQVRHHGADPGAGPAAAAGAAALGVAVLRDERIERLPGVREAVEEVALRHPEAVLTALGPPPWPRWSDDVLDALAAAELARTPTHGRLPTAAVRALARLVGRDPDHDAVVRWLVRIGPWSLTAAADLADVVADRMLQDHPDATARSDGWLLRALDVAARRLPPGVAIVGHDGRHVPARQVPAAVVDAWSDHLERARALRDEDLARVEGGLRRLEAERAELEERARRHGRQLEGLEEHRHRLATRGPAPQPPAPEAQPTARPTDPAWRTDARPPDSPPSDTAPPGSRHSDAAPTRVAPTDGPTRVAATDGPTRVAASPDDAGAGEARETRGVFGWVRDKTFGNRENT